MSEVLHLSFEADFTDSSASAHTVTEIGTPLISMSSPILGVGSGLFNSTDTLSVLTDADFNFTTLPFTLRIKTAYSGSAIVDYFKINTTGAGSVRVYANWGIPRIWFDAVDNSGINDVGIAVDIPATDCEFSIERTADGEFHIYVNGSLVASTTGASAFVMPYDAAGHLVIGGQGLIDEVIVDKGTALAGGASSYTIVPSNYYPAVFDLISEAVLPALDLMQTHVVNVNPLMASSPMLSASVSQTHIISIAPLSVTPTLPELAVSTPQSISINSLAATPSLSAFDVKQIHVLGITALGATAELPALDSVQTYAVVINALFTTAALSGLAISQTHVLDVVPLVAIPSVVIDADKCLGIAYSTDAKAVSTYSNFPFTGSTRFNGKTLFISDHGLFEQGGETDNGTPIKPRLKTGKMDFIQGQTGLISTQSLKIIPTSKVYVSADKQGGSLDLTVTADANSYPYSTAVTHAGFAVHAIPIGRGIKYNHIQLALAGNGCSKLHIESLRYEPTAIRRSER